MTSAATNDSTTDATAANAPAKPKAGLFGAVKETWDEFSKDDGMTQAAALAFYTGLSVAPMLSIAVWLTQIFLNVFYDARDLQATTDKIKLVATQVIGSQAAGPVDQLIGPAATAANGGFTLSGLLSILFLAVSASGVFGQLQSSLNIMWNVKATASSGGIVSLIRKRLFSFGMLFTLLFLMLVSMILTGIISGIETYFASHVGNNGGQATLALLVNAVNYAATLVIAAGVFAMLFKYLPDVKVPWRDTIVGALITAALFVIGKIALGIYLGKGSYESSYGAAIGSFVALLVWVYYTSVIIFIGAEATQVYARRHGDEPVAEDHAVKTKRINETVTAPAAVQPTTYTATRPITPSRPESAV